MIERFKGPRGQPLLLEALRSQRIVRDNEELAAELMSRIELLQIKKGETLVRQGDADNDLFLVLAGEFTVSVNDRPIAVRTAGRHIGEMSLIDPSARRSASIVANETAVVAKISEPAFSSLADSHPRLWRLIAMDLADRLRQRNELVAPRSIKPVLFIGSSTESLHVAREIQSGLSHDDVVVRVWTDQIFGASHFPIDDLCREVETSDFAALVLSPDDLVSSRDSIMYAPRDNVVFELGLFMGSLSRFRTFIVYPRGHDLKLPSDLLGLTPLEYAPEPSTELPSLVAPVCSHMRKAFNELGPR